MKPTAKSSKTRLTTPSEFREIVSKQPSSSSEAMIKEARERMDRKRPSPIGRADFASEYGRSTN